MTVVEEALAVSTMPPSPESCRSMHWQDHQNLAVRGQCLWWQAARGIDRNKTCVGCVCHSKGPPVHTSPFNLMVFVYVPCAMHSTSAATANVKEVKHPEAVQDV
eukprot:353273-Chlamydomonas_euryale.AAC.25